MRRPDTRVWLWNEIVNLFGVKLPHKRFTAGHSTPFDFVADAFFHPGQDLAAWANRSGLKTLGSSIIAALEYRYSDAVIRGRVLAGSEDQAKNLYEYWANWCFRVLPDRVKGEPGKLLTRLDNGNFEILAASQKRVRGAKVQRLYRDEIDEIAPDIYAASVGMLASHDGTPARTIDTSTWHYAHGPMGQLVEERENRGIRLHKWNVWESIARCPESRHDHGKGCRTCKLAAVCLAKRSSIRRFACGNGELGIAADCCGLLSIDDVIKQFSQWSLAQWEAEAECKRPTPEGLVYPNFRRSLHVRDDLDFDDDLPTFRAIDWGLNNFVCLWLQEDKHGNVYVVDEVWAEEGTLADNARIVQERDRKDDGSPYPISATHCDPAGRNRNDQTGLSDVDLWGGIVGRKPQYSVTRWAREVKNGIQLIRAFLKPANGEVRLFVSAACKMLIKAFESYKNRIVNGQYVDEPVKPQPMDHGMDALRYFMVNRHAPVRTEARPWRMT